MGVSFAYNHYLFLFFYLSIAVKVRKTLKNQTVTETQEAVFSLELTHENVRGSQWTKNGVEIVPSDKYEITMDGMVHTLKIKNCNTQDESVYAFKLGKLSANARLNVESKWSFCVFSVFLFQLFFVLNILDLMCRYIFKLHLLFL